jgi:membrane protease subunit HflC
MRRTFVILTLVILSGWAAVSSLFAVDQSEFAYVTQFGRPIQTLDGSTEAGLHAKWPWPIQSVQRLDRRLQMFDLPPAELPTFDPNGQTIDKMLTVDAYVCWQISDAEGADRFIRTVGSAERARAILGPRIGSRIGAVISRLPLDELIHVAESKTEAERLALLEARADKLRQLLMGDGADGVIAQARAEYGITIVDVRLRRFNYPESVRPAIFERIRSERRRKAAEYESDGEKKARDIRSAADRDAEITKATARANAERVRKQADADADRIRNEAHAQDRQFYEFLQKLDAFRQMLAQTSDVLLLSSKHPLFQLMLNPPEKQDGDSRRPNEKVKASP